ncbi:hypothetical protein GOP47_0001184 [Adiantum capillus-veneris]|uniref:Uncharacterized protein n=1 Tax=Adiantum capillus-veneris TaxID=13818 RepID=A0A9D4ZTS9_ADICA|nr:hypothetical protein GOP47_0001184 [Adiantum capillus-veneris]
MHILTKSCKPTHIGRLYPSQPYTILICKHNRSPSLSALTHNQSGANATMDSLHEIRRKGRLNSNHSRKLQAHYASKEASRYNDGINPMLAQVQPLATNSSHS